MKVRRLIIINFLLLILSTSVHAGFNGITFHSRANCVNNETISWDATRAWDLRTVSFHTNTIRVDGKLVQHRLDTGWENTRRSAAVCWMESMRGGQWAVQGQHWIILAAGETLIRTTVADDCSIYDGWWEMEEIG